MILNLIRSNKNKVARISINYLDVRDKVMREMQRTFGQPVSPNDVDDLLAGFARNLDILIIEPKNIRGRKKIKYE